MNIDLEKIKATIEELKVKTGEQYYEENKEAIKKNAIADFERNKQQNINFFTAMLNYLPSFEVKEINAEQQVEQQIENQNEEQQAEIQ
jgi:hypothetical protein